MPDISRQRKSGALIFTPTPQEQMLVDTQKDLDIKSSKLDDKLKEADALIEKLKKASEDVT